MLCDNFAATTWSVVVRKPWGHGVDQLSVSFSLIRGLPMSVRPHARRSRRITVAVSAGVSAGVALLTMSGAVPAVAASVQRSLDPVVVAQPLVLQETTADGTIACSSADDGDGSASCAAVNAYGGGVLMPGDSVVTTVLMSNEGSTTPKSFTLTAGRCTQHGPSAGGDPAIDLCGRLTVSVYAGTGPDGSPVFSGTPAEFAAATGPRLAVLGPKTAQPYTFVVAAPRNLGNSYQGLTVSQPLTWKLMP